MTENNGDTAAAKHLLRRFIDHKLREHPAAACSAASNRQLGPGTAARRVLEQLVVCRSDTVRVGCHVTYDGSYVLYIVGCNSLRRQNKESDVHWHGCRENTRSKARAQHAATSRRGMRSMSVVSCGSPVQGCGGENEGEGEWRVTCDV